MKTETFARHRYFSCRHLSILVLLVSVAAAASYAQTLTTLLSFDGTHGALPTTTLVQGLDGAMYGTTPGEIYRITPEGQAGIVYSPLATPNALVLANNGSFYGTTMDYAFVTCGLIGQVSCGSVFSLSPRGTLTSFFSFQPATEGAGPSTLVQAPDGNFYGTTVYGGANPCKPWVGCGTVFKITPAGQLTTLYNFCSQKNCADGSFPTGLVMGSDGAFYGTAYQGGETQAAGTVFRITSTGKFTILHAFCSLPNCADGFMPRGPLALGSDGNFYGTTESNGPNNSNGTIFKVTPTGSFTTLHIFCAQTGCPDGVEPNGGLIQANDGNLYGTTNGGGNDLTACNFSAGCGTIFKITPAGELTTLYAFDFSDGLNPSAGLVQRTDGTFYGTTAAGGSTTKVGCYYAQGCGTVFNFSTGLPPFVKLVSGSGKAGQTIGILGQRLTGTTDVSVNGMPASFAIISDTFIRFVIPSGATSGFVTVNTPSGTLTSNVTLLVR